MISKFDYYGRFTLFLFSSGFFLKDMLKILQITVEIRLIFHFIWTVIKRYIS